MATKKWAWLKELRFLQLTLFIIFFLFAFPLFAHDWVLRVVSNIFLLNAFLVSLSASDNKSARLKWLLWILFGVITGLTVLYLSPLEPAHRLIFLRLAVVCDIFLLLVCLAAVLRFIFESSEVTLDTIFAAVVAYLMIAFIFAQAYMLLHSLQPQSFNLSAPVTPTSYHIFEDNMVYYSLIVITTVGIGDIAPVTPVARALTAIEAMTGQFFVAILVAWLVGRFISQSPRPQPPSE